MKRRSIGPVSKPSTYWTKNRWIQHVRNAYGRTLVTLIITFPWHELHYPRANKIGIITATSALTINITSLDVGLKSRSRDDFIISNGSWCLREMTSHLSISRTSFPFMKFASSEDLDVYSPALLISGKKSLVT